MPTYSYKCSTHKNFDVLMPLPKGRPPKFHPCTFIIEDDLLGARPCLKPSKFIISPPRLITVQRDWNEQANEARRNPRVQIEVQKQNIENERKEFGLPEMEEMKPAPKDQVMRGKKLPPIVGG